jgi:hypothetical protein
MDMWNAKGGSLRTVEPYRECIVECKSGSLGTVEPYRVMKVGRRCPHRAEHGYVECKGRLAGDSRALP